MSATEFERIVEFLPAFDKRDPDPSKNYGIHGVELRMVLKGPLGATQFVLFTSWMLPHVQRETDERTIERGADAMQLRCFYHPQPADLGYHSPTPMYEGQNDPRECPYVEGGLCYYDGSGLRAEEVYVTLLERGSDGVWATLGEEYRRLFIDRED